MGKFIRIVTAALALMPALAMAQGTPAAATTASDSGRSALAKPDRQFVDKVARAGKTEIAAGKLATAQGSSAATKTFGQRMISDHTAAADELQTLAQSKSTALPTHIGKTNKKHLQTLRGLSGADFDRAYADMMVKDHEVVVQLFENTAANAADPDVKAFANKTLPTLREHLAMARKLPGG
jgi:putative membrane protein